MKHQPVWPSHSHFASITTKIAEGETTSGAIDIRGVNAGCAVFAAEFDSESISFLVSLDGVNFYVLAASTLSPTSGPVGLGLPAALFDWGWFKYVTNSAVSADATIPTGLKSGV